MNTLEMVCRGGLSLPQQVHSWVDVRSPSGGDEHRALISRPSCWFHTALTKSSTYRGDSSHMLPCGLLRN